MADDTIQVAEIHSKNSGKDPFPILLKRTKLPKLWEKVECKYVLLTLLLILRLSLHPLNVNILDIGRAKSCNVAQPIGKHASLILTHIIHSWT